MLLIDVSDGCQRHVIYAKDANILNKTCYGETKMIKTDGPNQQLSIDHFGKLPTVQHGMQYLLDDNFTKFVKIYPFRRATTRATLNTLLNDYCLKYLKPLKIKSDDHSTLFFFKHYRIVGYTPLEHFTFSFLVKILSQPHTRQHAHSIKATKHT